MDRQTILSRYTYDPLDRLASRTPLAEDMAQRFYKAGQLVTEIQGAEQRTFLRSDSQLLAQKNQSASTLLATDTQNSVLYAEDNAIAYAPYGHREAVNTLPGLPGFNGEQPDPATGHYLLGNGYRAYNPTLMRFNSPDSLSPFGEGGLNAYAYCVGDPVNRSDPTGHFGWVRAITNFLGRLSSRIVNGVAAYTNQRGRLLGAYQQGTSVRPAIQSPDYLQQRWAMKMSPPQSLQARAIDKILLEQLPTSELARPLQLQVFQRVERLSQLSVRQASLRRLRANIQSLSARTEYPENAVIRGVPGQLHGPGDIVEDYQSLGSNISFMLANVRRNRGQAHAPGALLIADRWGQELGLRPMHERY